VEDPQKKAYYDADQTQSLSPSRRIIFSSVYHIIAALSSKLIARLKPLSIAEFVHASA